MDSLQEAVCWRRRCCAKLGCCNPRLWQRRDASRGHAAGERKGWYSSWLAGEGCSAGSQVEGGRCVAAEKGVRPQKLADGVEMGVGRRSRGPAPWARPLSSSRFAQRGAAVHHKPGSGTKPATSTGESAARPERMGRNGSVSCWKPAMPGRRLRTARGWLR